MRVLRSRRLAGTGVLRRRNLRLGSNRRGGAGVAQAQLAGAHDPACRACTSAPDAFDDALAGAEVHVAPGNPDIAVTVTIPVDGGTLDRLTERAEREGRDIEQVVADALRAAAV